MLKRLWAFPTNPQNKYGRYTRFFRRVMVVGMVLYFTGIILTLCFPHSPWRILVWVPTVLLVIGPLLGLFRYDALYAEEAQRLWEEARTLESWRLYYPEKYQAYLRAQKMKLRTYKLSRILKP